MHTAQREFHRAQHPWWQRALTWRMRLPPNRYVITLALEWATNGML